MGQGVRDLESDERFVIDEFERHAAYCSQCSLALDSAQAILCECGHTYAVDVSNYLYSQGGRHFAVVDRENGRLRRIQLPRESKEVLRLLEGIEAGILPGPSRKAAPRPRGDGTSYDRTYPTKRRAKRSSASSQKNLDSQLDLDLLHLL